MRNKTIAVLITICSSLIFLTAVFAENTLVVIANGNVSQAEISSRELADVYLGKKLSWDNGAKIAAAMLEDGPAHGTFTKNFLKKSASQFSTFWKQAIFTGQGIPPKSFKSEQDLISFVSSTPGAIGYVSAITASEGLKVLTIK